MAVLDPINIGAADDDGTGDPIRTSFNKSNLADAAINAELEALLTAVGAVASAVDLGVFTGSTIGDNQTARAALQDVETALEGVSVLSGAYAPDNTGMPAVADPLETAIAKVHYVLAQLNEATRMAGTFDATVGTYPTAANGGAVNGNPVEAGYTFLVDVAGTVDGIAYAVGDRLIALVDAPANNVTAGNWFHADYNPNLADTAPVAAFDGIGAVGTSTLAARQDHAHPLDVVPEYVTAAGPVTLHPATGSGVRRLFILDPTGPELTLQPTAGEQVNGVVNGTKVYDTGNAQISAVDAAAGQWTVSQTSSFAGTSARLGEFFYAKSGRTETGLLAVSAGTVTNGATLYPKWAAMYPEFVSGANIVFPSDVEGMFLRNVGGNAETEGTSQADGTAVNGLRALRTYVQSDWNAQSNDDFGKGSGSLTGAANNGVGMSSSDPETRPANRAYQLYTIVDGYGDSYAAGTLVAEPNADLLVEVLAGDGGPVDWSAADLMQYEYLDFYLEAISTVSGPYQFSRRIPVDRLADANIWQGDGVNTFSMGINAAGTVGTMSYAGTFNVAGTQRVYGVRKQHNAIRAEDLPVDKTGLAAGDLLEWDGTQLVRAAGPSTGFVNNGNYTGSPDDATTQGIYENTTGPMPGGPVANFVWTLDVDVFGDHIKQTFNPRDAGTTVLGYWVRRSFDGGTTWTAWAGR